MFAPPIALTASSLWLWVEVVFVGWCLGLTLVVVVWGSPLLYRVYPGFPLIAWAFFFLINEKAKLLPCFKKNAF
jgi:hypothetical protein